VPDIRSGTGCLALRLAASGRSAVALDPAEASLRVAKAKVAADKVMWINGVVSALPALSLDLATMTGNMAQVFSHDDERTQVLRVTRRALRPGGHLTFEARHNEHPAWLQWAAQTNPVVLAVAGMGTVSRHMAVTAVRQPFVSLRHAYRFARDGALSTSDSTLRLRGRSGVESDLAACGVQVADVRDVPDRPRLEFVFVAQRTR
jgi:ubiquinone/menaquinone biosynthesis C-methylase UbiE